MRITPAISDRNFLNNVQMLNDLLEEASQQVATGKKLVQLRDFRMEYYEYRRYRLNGADREIPPPA